MFENEAGLKIVASKIDTHEKCDLAKGLGCIFLYEKDLKYPSCEHFTRMCKTSTVADVNGKDT